MADFFQSQPNFTNPSYATPEQLATQRAYAAELKRAADRTLIGLRGPPQTSSMR